MKRLINTAMRTPVRHFTAVEAPVNAIHQDGFPFARPSEPGDASMLRRARRAARFTRRNNR
ncbi:MAG: hypothetical protein AAF829_12155 [Pseudomonadota bacterium]